MRHAFRASHRGGGFQTERLASFVPAWPKLTAGMRVVQIRGHRAGEIGEVLKVRGYWVRVRLPSGDISVQRRDLRVVEETA